MPHGGGQEIEADRAAISQLVYRRGRDLEIDLTSEDVVGWTNFICLIQICRCRSIDGGFQRHRKLQRPETQSTGRKETAG